MKATELRIGSTYLSTKFGVPVTLELADLCELYHRCDGAEIDEDTIDSLVKPIPLTEELMVKFGAYIVYGHKSKWCVLELFPENELMPYIYFKEMGAELTSESGETITTVYFVHQLQNLYSVLTGKELI